MKTQISLRSTKRSAALYSNWDIHVKTATVTLRLLGSAPQKFAQSLSLNTVDGTRAAFFVAAIYLEQQERWWWFEGCISVC